MTIQQLVRGIPDMEWGGTMSLFSLPSNQMLSLIDDQLVLICSDRSGHRG